MSSSWSIRIAEQAPSRLVVVDPPFTAIAIGIWCVAGLLVMLALLNPGGFVLEKLAKFVPLPPVGEQLGHLGARFAQFVLAVVALPFALLGAGLWATKTEATFSREAGTLRVECRTFGFPNSMETPLSKIRQASVESGMRGRRLIVIVDGIGAVRLTSYTNREGHYKAAEAINEFLKIR